MSRPINAFFEIHIKGKLDKHTPVSVVSGILHCVEVPSDPIGTSVKFLPIGYYSDVHTSPGATSINSLRSIRENPFEYVAQTGPGATLDFTTESFRVQTGANGITVTSSPPIEYGVFDTSFTKLAFNATSVVEAFPTYNELDSDVVLTTAAPSAWTRPSQSEVDKIVIKEQCPGSCVLRHLRPDDRPFQVDYIGQRRRGGRYVTKCALDAHPPI